MDWRKARKSDRVRIQSEVWPARPKGDPMAPRQNFNFTDVPRYRVMRGDKAAAGAFPKVHDLNPAVIDVLRRKD